MAASDTQALRCACGHTGVRYRSNGGTMSDPRMMAGGFVYRGTADFDLAKLWCGVCHQLGQVRAA